MPSRPSARLRRATRGAIVTAVTVLTTLAFVPSAHAKDEVIAQRATGATVATKSDGPQINGIIWSVQNCDGRWEDFRVAADNSAEHRYQLSVGGPWSGWDPLGGRLLYGDLGVGRNGDCRIEVFGVGTDHRVWTRWQSQPSAGPWANWTSIGGYLTSAPYTTIIGGTLAVCALGGDTPPRTWCNRHTQPYGSPWTGWFVA